MSCNLIMLLEGLGAGADFCVPPQHEASAPSPFNSYPTETTQPFNKSLPMISCCTSVAPS
jgi:hypothetical protein